MKRKGATRSSAPSPTLLRAALLLLLVNTIAVEGSFRLCGFRLTMTLTAICKNQICGGYVAPPAKRRGADADPEPYELLSDGLFVDDGDYTEGGTDSFELANGYGSQAPRWRHAAIEKRAGGIATECCEKRCTLAYLKTFCCAALQLPSPGGGGGGGGVSSAQSGKPTAVAAGSSKAASLAAALLATGKKTAARVPAVAFVGGDDEDLLMVR